MIQSLSSLPTTSYFPFELTQQQQRALDKMWNFVQPHTIPNLFLLVGFAGTGKTTITFQLVKVLISTGKRVVLTAPTNKLEFGLIDIHKE